jgi:hypothetical protein
VKRKRKRIHHNRTRTKPEGLPTLPDMICMSLKQLKKPATPARVTKVIAQRWWPGCNNQWISPTMRGMALQGRLKHKLATHEYRLP